MIFGQPYEGTDFAPSMLRKAGLHKVLTDLGWRVEDLQDLDFNSFNKSESASITYNINDNNSDIHLNAKNSEYVGRGCRILASIVEQKANQNKFPLILGGDHSIAMGSLAGILRARPRTGVLWVDAHADLNTPATSRTGNMHGMPLGMLMEGMGVNHKSIPGCEWLAEEGAPKLKSDSLVYIGLRDVDNEEKKVIKDLGITAFTMFDIDKLGIGKVMEMAMQHLLKNDSDRPIHLSYDIDAADPSIAPATGTSVIGGLNYREAHYVAEATVASGLLASADLVEFNPMLTNGLDAQKTAGFGMDILTSIMGKRII